MSLEKDGVRIANDKGKGMIGHEKHRKSSSIRDGYSWGLT